MLGICDRFSHTRWNCWDQWKSGGDGQGAARRIKFGGSEQQPGEKSWRAEEDGIMIKI